MFSARNFVMLVDSESICNKVVWKLIGQTTEDGQVQHIAIIGDSFSVGRSAASNLCLPTTSVSGRHAELRVVGERLYLKDLSSTNGTYLNGAKVRGEVELKSSDLIQFAKMVFRVNRSGADTGSRTVSHASEDGALAIMQFDRLINDGGLLPFYQPIVSMVDRQVVGHEVLGRSRLYGLQMPDEMFRAATQLNMEAELSEGFRFRGVQVAQPRLRGSTLFVNTHPNEIGTSRLLHSLATLRELAPQQSIAVEIHEGARAHLVVIKRLRAVLHDLDMQLAFDDFGVGQSRLVELAEIRPDYLKFDMQLTKNIDAATPAHQDLIRSFTKMVNDLGIKTLAEGVENEASHELLLDMGFHLGQGFLYGRPLPIGETLS
jgi:EAL domain-containing protein (putative c-di-GMP-specific phosphodiesterase class I)